METKETKYIIKYKLDENGKPVIGEWIREDIYIRKKKLNKIKKLIEKNG
jgi:hypothetical protein